MTSLASRIGLALALAATTQVSAAAIRSGQAQPAKAPPPRIAQSQSIAPTLPMRAPTYLDQRIDALGQGVRRPRRHRRPLGRGRLVGRLARPTSCARSRACRSCGWRSPRSTRSTAAACGSTDKVSLGTQRPHPVPPADPQAKILGGGYTTTLANLMLEALTKSDNTANDKLMRSVGGPAGGARDDRAPRAWARSASTTASARCRAGSPA